MENNNGGNTVLMTVIGVATLLVALVGATFAYFSIRINNNNAESISVTTANPVALVYVGGKTLTLPNALPGDMTGANDVNGQFTIYNDKDSSLTQSYDLIVKVDENTFTNQHTKVTDPNAPGYDANDALTGTTTQNGQMLVNILSATSTMDSGYTGGSTPTYTSGNTTGLIANSLDFTDGTTYTTGQSQTFVNDQNIVPGETHQYQIQLEFHETNNNQDENKNQSFAAHIEVTDPKTVR